IPNLPIRDLRTKINDLGIHSQIKDARETLLQSPIFDAVREANLSALKVTEGIIRNSAIDEIKRMSATMAKDWTNFKDLVSPQMQVDKFLNAHLAQIIQTSALAQSALANIEISKITGAFQLADDMRISFRDKFTDFATSYKDLFKSFEIPETSLFRLPPSISEMPTIEFFNGVDLLETTVEEVNHDEYEELRIIVREEIRQSTKDSVIIQLQEVNPDWIKMLEGARQAFNSTNPDKNRQCITSLRELFRDIMLYLSPDEQIKDWSNSMDDFANNRPTRKARLRYIARNINHGAFTKFVEKDIEAIIAAIDIFQAGTHVVNSKLTDAQMNALFFRAESTILFLFSIANYEE
ncbi:MAG TPA: hypothetical protein DEA22_14010, partial [Blastocatellia bacterium]|nr:hypothetical protein [Blastocatellia bacterium]